MFDGPMELERCTFEIEQELAPEFTRKHLDGEEELLAGVALLSIRCQPATRNNTVQVRMKHKVLPPGMQDGGKANLCSQIGVIRRQLR